MGPSRGSSGASLIVAGLLTASLILTVELVPARDASLLLADSLETAIVLWAAISAFRVSRRSIGYLRQLWTLFAIALFWAAAAQGLETYYQNIPHLTAFVPWPSDILFMLWVTPAVMMLLPRSSEDPTRFDWQQVLDFAQVVVVALTAYLYFFYVPSRWQAEGAQMVSKVARLQTIRDATLAALFFAAAAAAAAPPVRKLFARIAVFFLLSGAAEFAYLFTSRATEPLPNWNDLAWCVPYLFVTVVASEWRYQNERVPDVRTSRLRIWMASQTVPLCIPLLVLFMGRSIASAQVTIAWIAVTASFLLSAGRLILTIQEQRRIADHLRHAEAALQQSAEMFATAFSSSPDAISMSLLPEGRYIAVNRSFVRMTGYSEEEILGRSAAELNLWVSEVRHSAILESLRTGSEIRDEEFQFRTKSGEVRAAQVSAARIQIGGAPGILGMVRDITLRKNAEEALRASEKRFRSLIEELHVGVVLLNAKAEIQFANQAVLKMFGRTEDMVLGRQPIDLDLIAVNEDGADIPWEMRPVPRAIRTGEPVRNEVIGWRKPDSEAALWIMGGAIPILRPNGEIDHVIASFSDITKLKEAEERLHQLSAHLLELQDDERRRLGRELHDSLAQSVMAVNLDLAKVARCQSSLTDGATRALSDARATLREMSREIRTMSYLLHPPVLDELGLATAVKEYAEGFGSRSGIQLKLELQPNFGRLPQETETALFRIVQESLANIQKHSGSPTAKIRLCAGADGVELEVSDHGCGFDNAMLETRSASATRLGVGILGMRERMAQLGGKLDVDSSSSGTTVRAKVRAPIEAAHVTSHLSS